MRRPGKKTFLRLLVLLFLLVPLSSQAADFQSTWVKRVINGDTVLLTNGERVKLIGVETLGVHESKKLYRDAKRSRRDIETIRALGRRASVFTKSSVGRKQIRLEFEFTQFKMAELAAKIEAARNLYMKAAPWRSLGGGLQRGIH